MHLDKSVVGFGTFFLVMALIVPPGLHAHWGMQGIFLAMIAALLLSFLAVLAWTKLREKMTQSQIRGRELAGFMVGYTPDTDVVESANGVRFARSGDLLSMLAQGDDEQALVPLGTDHYADEDDADEEELPDQIIEPNGLYLSDTFVPGVESMLGHTLLFCGIRRAGKSNGMAVVAEELASYGVPLLVCDTEDEYGPLANQVYLPRGILAGSADLLQQSTALRNSVAIDARGAYEFGRSILEDSLQVVLSLKSFADDNEAALVMCELIAGMHAWESSRANAQRVPCMVFLDEANKWLPQNERESYVSREVQVELQKAMFGTMVRRGGKQGLGLALTTQRIVELDKRALQTTWKFLFQQTEQVDIDRYRALGLDKDEIMSLRRGECFVYSPQVIGFRIAMRARRSPHLAHTPGLEQLLAHRRRLRPVEYVTSRSFTGQGETQQAHEEPGEQIPTTETLPLTGTLRSTVTRHTRPQTMLERALEMWNAGHQTVLEMAIALSTEQDRVPESEAYRLICQLDAKGLITRKTRKRT
ncbi:MAG TPA: hypothetical protein VF844_07505 [Ktedonobacteraceae bacterium]